MKLSEAILLGSVGSEQGFGCLSIYKNEQGRCALGAALYAIGREVDEKKFINTPYDIIREVWPWVDKKVDKPATNSEGVFSHARVIDIIWDLNDTAKWTRPRIAQWVAELEKVYDPTSVEVKECKHAHS